MTDGRKIFIDCGANRGQSVERFRQVFPDHADWEIYCIEADVEVARQIDLTPNRGAVLPVAAWVAAGQVTFYRGPSTLGSTLYADKTTGNIAAEPVLVPSIDLGRFLQSVATRQDYVVLKLNVEGAEYRILESLVATGNLHLVDRLFVRWHQAKIPSISEAEHDGLVKAIEAAGQHIEDFW